jgi:hypothetical protein
MIIRDLHVLGIKTVTVVGLYPIMDASSECVCAGRDLQEKISRVEVVV